MKKINLYALMSAIALTSAVGFTACSSSDEATADVNPTFDGTSVRTDFAFNITKASQATTRMDANHAQELTSAANTDGFLGISDMYLFPFALGPGNKPTSSSVTNLPVSATTPSYYPLGSLTATDLASRSSKVYTMSIPVGTDNFLFYGRATNSGSAFEKGSLTSNITTSTNTTANISFSLDQINAELGSDATNIANYLTAIAGAKNTAGDITWAASVTKAATIADYSALSKLYTEYTKNQVDRSGSAESVVRLVTDLYKSAYAISVQSANSDVAQIAADICVKIETTTSGVKVEIHESKTSSTVVTRPTTFPADPNVVDNWAGVASGFNASFPSNLDLPMGAAIMKWDGSAFIYVDNPLYHSGVSSLTSSTKTDKYHYPAELIYFDNSPLRATAVYKNVNDYPTSTATWDVTGAASSAAGFTSDWSQTSVLSSTRAVAMQNNVNYGVALLETTVSLKSGVTALKDNMSQIVSGAADQTTLVPANYEVTGLLVGGQPAKVNWDMVNRDDDFLQVIYDNAVVFYDATSHTKTLANLTTSDKNYTIVLDNLTSKTTQNTVRIALQLKNKGGDFYGLNGMIPAGSTFYLLGELNPSKAATARTIPNIGGSPRSSVYRITEEATERVFVQDYKTIANITLAADALKNAYSIIPDLRSTEVLFGLSVDLVWQAGMQFDVQIGAE